MEYVGAVHALCGALLALHDNVPLSRAILNDKDGAYTRMSRLRRESPLSRTGIVFRLLMIYGRLSMVSKAFYDGVTTSLVWHHLNQCLNVIHMHYWPLCPAPKTTMTVAKKSPAIARTIVLHAMLHQRHCLSVDCVKFRKPSAGTRFKSTALMIYRDQNPVPVLCVPLLSQGKVRLNLTALFKRIGCWQDVHLRHVAFPHEVREKADDKRGPPIENRFVRHFRRERSWHYLGLRLKEQLGRFREIRSRLDGIGKKRRRRRQRRR